MQCRSGGWQIGLFLLHNTVQANGSQCLFSKEQTHKAGRDLTAFTVITELSTVTYQFFPFLSMTASSPVIFDLHQCVFCIFLMSSCFICNLRTNYITMRLDGYIADKNDS